MQFDSLIRKRKSVHSFTKKKAHWKSILDAIDAAIQNPYAGNHNNLKFIIIEDKETIKDIAKMAEQHWIAQAPTLLVICSDDLHLEDKYGERGRVYSRQQAGAAIQTILFKLTNGGLAACWVGAYSDEVLKQTLKIPQHIQVEAVIPVGYENIREKQIKPEKVELENVLYWEKWDQWSRPPLFKEPKDKESLS